MGPKRARPQFPPCLELILLRTPDGLLLERCVLKPGCASDEADLRKLAERILSGLVVTLPSEPSPGASRP